jgi:hypothetical protein
VTQLPDDDGLLAVLLGDGTPLLSLAGISLTLSGLFALFLSATQHFLPHDVQFLGMSPDELCSINECRIVHFMFHDRVSFGGVLIAIGTVYLWLAAFPLRRGEAWAWWLFAASGVAGFGSFLAYLGYGYLDTWHGVATLGLLPCFLIGLMRARSLVERSRPRSLLKRGDFGPWTSRAGIGRLFLLATAAGMMGAGATITTVGMTSVFVPQDLVYIGLDAENLRLINPRLVPLIAHDRAGFGGGVLTSGLLLAATAWCAKPARSLWQAWTIAGVAGFTTAIGIHPLIGYNDAVHLAPAVTGAILMATGLALTAPRRPLAATKIASAADPA